MKTKLFLASALTVFMWNPAFSKPVTDFEKSVCAKEARGTVKAVAIKMSAEFGNGTEIVLRDGKTDWSRVYHGLDRKFVSSFHLQGPDDSWALYTVTEQDGRIVRFHERFLFGGPGGCKPLSPSANTVHVNSMAPLAATMYASRLLGRDYTDPEEARSALMSMLADGPTAGGGGRSANAAHQSGSAVAIEAIEEEVARAARGHGAGAPEREGRAPAIANACGVPVPGALVEYGKYRPPRIVIPAEIPGGGMESVIGTDIKEPLTAMCFSREGDENSIFRVPLPQKVNRCVFDDGALACWERPGFLKEFFGNKEGTEPESGYPVAASESEEIVEYPEPVSEAIDAWATSCAENYGAEPAVAPEGLNDVDIDGDGDVDWILDGVGFSCVENGRTVSSGGGNGGAFLKVFQVTTKGTYLVVDDFTLGATVTRHDGFAVIETASGVIRAKGGRKEALKAAPRGGNIVFDRGM